MKEPTEQSGRYEGKFTKKKVKKQRRHPVLRVLAIILVVLFVIGLGLAITYMVLYHNGKRAMLVYDNDDLHVDVPTAVMRGEEETERIIRGEDGTSLEYNGHRYEINRDLLTILVLGIDNSLEREDTLYGDGGQSDVVLLVGFDTETGKATMLNISREAYAQVEVYAADGKFVETRFEQLCLAYAYGEGKELSCENTVRSVTRLLYGLPISSYLALDMDAIVKANDIIGGVKLRALESMKLPDGTYIEEGELVQLYGRNLETYLRRRDQSKVDSNGPRMEREQQFMLEFIKALVAKSKSDFTFPVTLFQKLSDDLITDLSLSRVTFLSSCFLEHGAAFSMRSIDGSYGKLNGSPVYYLDDTDLFEAVLQVFYKQVD